MPVRWMRSADARSAAADFKCGAARWRACGPRLTANGSEKAGTVDTGSSVPGSMVSGSMVSGSGVSGSMISGRTTTSSPRIAGASSAACRRTVNCRASSWNAPCSPEPSAVASASTARSSANGPAPGKRTTLGAISDAAAAISLHGSVGATSGSRTAARSPPRPRSPAHRQPFDMGSVPAHAEPAIPPEGAVAVEGGQARKLGSPAVRPRPATTRGCCSRSRAKRRRGPRDLRDRWRIPR